MRARPSVTIVGPGRLGSALAVALSNAGVRVAEVVGRDQRTTRALARRVGAAGANFESARFESDVIWSCVKDEAVHACAEQIATALAQCRRARPRHLGARQQQVALHSSGALSSDELEPLGAAGLAVASVHPMMSFVGGVIPDLNGVTFAIEGDTRAVNLAKHIVRTIGGRHIAIDKKKKALYHAWGAFGSPLITATLAAADEVAAAVGLADAQARKTLAPMLRQTIENYIAHGAGAAFSGPFVRGDVATVRRHLDALKQVPEARDAYLALVRTALALLPGEQKAEMKRLLAAI